jgi:hypothetical protein
MDMAGSSMTRGDWLPAAADPPGAYSQNYTSI